MLDQLQNALKPSINTGQVTLVKPESQGKTQVELAGERSLYHIDVDGPLDIEEGDQVTIISSIGTMSPKGFSNASGINGVPTVSYAYRNETKGVDHYASAGVASNRKYLVGGIAVILVSLILSPMLTFIGFIGAFVGAWLISKSMKAKYLGGDRNEKIQAHAETLDWHNRQNRHAAA